MYLIVVFVQIVMLKLGRLTVAYLMGGQGSGELSQGDENCAFPELSVLLSAALVPFKAQSAAPQQVPESVFCRGMFTHNVRAAWNRMSTT